MNDPEGAARAKLVIRRRGPLLGCLLVVLGVVCGGGGGYIWSRYYRAGPENVLEEHLQDLRARGEPVAWRDLFDPDLRPEDNGAPVLRKAWDWLEANSPPYEEWPGTAAGPQSYYDGLSELEREELAQHIETLDPFFKRIREVVQRPYLRFREPDAGRRWAWVPVPHHITASKRTAQLLHLSRQCLAQEDLRLARVRQLFLLGALWVERPSIGDSLFALWLRSEALRALREDVMNGRISAAAAREVIAPLLTGDHADDYESALRGERVAALELTRRVLGDDEGRLPPELVEIAEELRGGAAFLVPAFRESCITFSGDIDACLQAAKERRGAYAVLVRERMQRQGGFRGALHGAALVNAVKVLLPGLLIDVVELECQERLCRAALEIAAYRERTGAWPDSLAALGDALPAAFRIDPFSDTGILFERLPDGVRIWSVGPDPAVWSPEVAGRVDTANGGLVWQLRD